MVVIWKPGMPDYGIPKAYRPIALLCTMAKLLTSIVAADMSNMIEREDLLPGNHFGGRPGWMTTDAMHTLVNKIKTAWRCNKVVSVLYLDVEGAFPNAVTDRLIHNLQKRRIPEVYIQFIKVLLMGRHTRMKFDDFVSDFILILNGIRQGDCEGPKDAQRLRDDRVRMGQPLKLICDYNGATNAEARGG